MCHNVGKMHKQQYVPIGRLISILGQVTANKKHTVDRIPSMYNFDQFKYINRCDSVWLQSQPKESIHLCQRQILKSQGTRGKVQIKVYTFFRGEPLSDYSTKIISFTLLEITVVSPDDRLKHHSVNQLSNWNTHSSPW